MLRLTLLKKALKQFSPCRAHIQALDRSVSKAEADWEASVQRRVSGAAKQAAVWQDAAAAVASLQQGLQQQAAAVAERAAKVRQLRQHMRCQAVAQAGEGRTAHHHPEDRQWSPVLVLSVCRLRHELLRRLLPPSSWRDTCRQAMPPSLCFKRLQAAAQAAEEDAATQEHAEELKARIAARQDWIDKEQV